MTAGALVRIVVNNSLTTKTFFLPYINFIAMLILIAIGIALFSSPALSIPEKVEILLKELSGRHLRFSASPIPSLLNIRKNPNGTFSYSGAHVEAVDYVARLLNVSYSFVNVNESEADRVGQKDASIGLLMRNEVEVTTYTMLLHYYCVDQMDCSFPLIALNLGMLVPWPEEGTRILAIIQPFQPMVWLSIFISFVAMTFALVVIPGIYFKFIAGKFGHSSLEITTTFSSSSIWSLTHLGNATVYLATVLTSQGNWVRFKQLSFRIVVASWCLAALVIVNAYSSTLISYLTASKIPITKSLEELAERSPQDLLVMTEKNSASADFFLEATSGPLKVLGDSLRNNPETLITNRLKAFNMMYNTGHYAYLGPDPLIYSYMEAANKKAGYCKFTVSKRHLVNTDYYGVYTFPKNWRYTDAVNYKLMSWWEAGLIDHWLKMYQPSMTKCSLDNYKETSAKIRKLSKLDLIGCFILLLLGLLLAFLVFLIERILALAKKIRA